MEVLQKTIIVIYTQDVWSVQLQLVSGESIIRKYYKMYKVFKMLQEQLSWKENGSEKLLQKMFA